MIDDVSVWNVALDAAAVMDYFLNGIPDSPYPDALVAYYRFNEGKTTFFLYPQSTSQQ